MPLPLSPPQAAGFLLASYAVIGNDALQTLGPFLAANRGRTPRALQAAFLCAVLCGVLVLGWHLGQGDPAWGRLELFPLPQRFGWLDLLPPLAVLALTQGGAPVSTSFLVLTAFEPGNLPALLLRSLSGYAAGLVVGGVLYALVGWLLERRVQEPGAPPHAGWLALQWLATAWLWGQWLVQDLANIYVYLPRRLSAAEMALSLLVLCAGVGLLLLENGGAIQQRYSRKSHSHDPRSASTVSILYGLILFGFSRLGRLPMSTTWVFLGLIAGRELALLWRLRERSTRAVASDLGQDVLRAGLGLAVSVAVALGVAALKPA